MNDLTAHQAIDRSTSHTETVYLEYSTEAEDTLNSECEDSCEANSQTDFWGRNRDGHEWRVILRHRSEPQLDFDEVQS